MFLKIGKKMCAFCHLRILPKEKRQMSGMLVFHTSCWDALRGRECNLCKEPEHEVRR